MNARQRPNILERAVRAKSTFFTIESMRLRFSNGNVREFERIASSPAPGTVTIVAIHEDGDLLLVREYAAGLDRYEWALPSGQIASGESPEAAAARELAEETGYCARSFERVCRLALAPSIFAYQTEVLLARGLYVCRLEGDEPEGPEIAFCPLEDVGGPNDTPPICDARAIAAICATKRMLRTKDAVCARAECA